MTNLNLTEHKKKQAKIDADTAVYEAKGGTVKRDAKAEPKTNNRSRHNASLSMMKADRMLIVKGMLDLGLDKHDIAAKMEMHLSTVETYIRELNR